MPEGDEVPGDPVRPAPKRTVEDNSVGRLLALSDGVFAIAMTLFTLDLKVPGNLAHQTNHDLQHALTHSAGSYGSFLLSFYVVAGYWIRHRRVMRSVVAVHANLIRHTLLLLVLVAAMPFFASLLGQYGSIPFALALYGAANAAAVIVLLLLNRDVRILNLADDGAVVPDDLRNESLWLVLAVFVLCIPAGYVLGRHGPYVFFLLLIPNVIARASWVRSRFSSSPRPIMSVPDETASASDAGATE